MSNDEDYPLSDPEETTVSVDMRALTEKAKLKEQQDSDRGQVTEEFSVEPHPTYRTPVMAYGLTAISGPERGAIFYLDASKTIGRDAECEIVARHQSVSRQHARLHFEGGRFFVEDLGSRNGTFVNGKRVERRLEIFFGDRVQLGSATVFVLSQRDTREFSLARENYEKAVRDPLTGAYNRHFALEWLARECSSARRRTEPLTVVAIDIDHFKQVNDSYGHAAGDAVLVHVVRAIANELRSDSIVARFGGEEFLVFVRGLDQQNAAAFVERLRESVEGLDLSFEGTTIRVTASFGYISSATVSSCPPEILPDMLLREADAFLYEAKRLGRNCAVTASAGPRL